MGRFARLLVWLAMAGAAPAQEMCCVLRVSVRTGGGHAVAGASVRVESGASRLDVRLDEQGDATLELRTPGQYRATASAPGYSAATGSFEIAREERKHITLLLVRHESVTVEGRAPALEASGAAAEATREQVRSLPERVADVRAALPLIPGVVRTPEGKLQITGSPEYRSTFLVNGLDVTDPGTGSFGATVPVDVIETVQVYKSPFLAEYGRFSAAVVAVSTRRGGDKWHYEVNDPTPEFRIRSRRLRGIRGFTPRLAATGPLLRNRLFFSGAGSFELRKRPVYPLSWPFNEEKSQRVNAYVQLDFVRGANRLISFSAHGVPQRVRFAGIDFYTPQPAAPSAAGHEARAAISDRMETTRGLFETALAGARVQQRTFPRGGDPLRLTPVTSLGNYFFSSTRTSDRLQLVEAWTPKPVGAHQFRLGGTLARTGQSLSASAHTVEVLSLAGAPLAAIPYTNSPPSHLANYDGGVFVQDGWAATRLLRLDAGLRVDADRLARAVTAAPRLGFAWMPAEGARTVLRGGIGWFYDKVPLHAFAFPHFPRRFGLPNLVADGRLAPHSRTLSAALDYRLTPSVLLHAGFTQSDAAGLLVVRPDAGATTLAADGSARSREMEVSAKLTLRAGQSWVVAYTRTAARGNLNVFDRFGGGDFPAPLLRPDIAGRLPDVIPHRLLTWGVFPLRWGLGLAPVLEWRSGFPWSALDERRQYAAPPNTGALPAFFSLDARLSKDIPYRKHKVRLSFSVFNLTGHGNYDAVRLNTADPQFGEVLGLRPRRFRLDFDWLF